MLWPDMGLGAAPSRAFLVAHGYPRAVPCLFQARGHRKHRRPSRAGSVLTLGTGLYPDPTLPLLRASVSYTGLLLG